ncbi:GNAT family N-acetyltransferase [Crocinitomix sp.]|nr:GNAT family N-acetyltransferase [Crocinitomix sp.]
MKYLLTDIETDRLTFRVLEENDFETWKPLFYEADAIKFLVLDATKSVDELCRYWFDKAFHRYENDLGGMNVLIDKLTGQFIGQCGLLIQDYEGVDFMEVGYSILPAHWGKGYASEAAIKCKEEAFHRNYTDHLRSIVHVDNIGSAAVALKNGMQLERKIDDYEGAPINMFGISKKRFIAQSDKR